MYDCGVNERKFMVFDVKVLSEDGVSFRWLKHDELVEWCKERDLPMVPVLYRGPFNLEHAKSLTIGDDFGNQSVREGVVIRDPNETETFIGKKVLKLISEIYLSRDNTEYH